VKRFTEPCYSSLTEACPVWYVFYNLCYELWSRTCIKCFDSRVTNIVFWNQLNIWICFNLQKSPPWKLKPLPKSRKSQNRPATREIAPRGFFWPTLKTTELNETKPRTEIYKYVHRNWIGLVHRIETHKNVVARTVEMSFWVFLPQTPLPLFLTHY